VHDAADRWNVSPSLVSSFAVAGSRCPIAGAGRLLGKSKVIRDPARTLALAEIALNQIKAFGLPADPESYAVWFAYAAASKPELNKKIDDLIAARAVSLAEVDRIHDEHLSPVRMADRADKIGTVLSDQIEHIIDLIEAAVASSGSLEMHLATANQELSRTVDRETIKAVVETLVTSIKGMEQRASSFQEALQASHGVVEALKEDLAQAHRDSNTDPVTSLSNRRYFDSALDKAITTATQNGSPLSLLFIDVDRFKEFNDAHGHQMGDDVLRLLGTALKRALNGDGFAARVGGEEFAVVLPNAELSQAQGVAENIRTSIMSREVLRRATRERLGRITVSIGVAQYEPSESASALIDRADRHLSRAKQQGRNLVVWQPEQS
jgi:diguanylate cyclase